MRLIIVNGLPATGKTYIANSLSRAMDIPEIGKDDIKEFLFEKLGVRDRDWSRSLGMASNDFIYVLAEALLGRGHSLIIENAFEVSFARPKLHELMQKYHPDVTEIYCHTEKDVRRKRFVERNESGERHVGHRDDANYIAEGEPEPYDRFGRLELGKVIEVDTTDFRKVDIQTIIERISPLST